MVPQLMLILAAPCQHLCHLCLLHWQLTQATTQTPFHSLFTTAPSNPDSYEQDLEHRMLGHSDEDDSLPQGPFHGAFSDDEESDSDISEVPVHHWRRGRCVPALTMCPQPQVCTIKT